MSEHFYTGEYQIIKDGKHFRPELKNKFGSWSSLMGENTLEEAEAKAKRFIKEDAEQHIVKSGFYSLKDIANDFADISERMQADVAEYNNQVRGA